MATGAGRILPADSLGARVRAARLERGLSQAQLAGDELTKGFISQLESGAVRPSIRSLQIIAGRLGKSLDYFLGDEPLSTQKRAEFFELAAEQRAQFHRWTALAHIGHGNFEAAFAAVDESLAHADAAGDPAGYAWI